MTSSPTRYSARRLSPKAVQLQGTTGVNAGNPVVNGGAFGILINAPGTNGVPPCGPTTDEPILRPPATSRNRDFPMPAAICSGDHFKRVSTSVFSRRFKLNERFSLRYDAQFFNIFNHPSFDAPNNNISLNPCFGPNLQTSPANGCQWQGTIPAVAPSTTAFGDGTAPFGAGFIQSTLGSPRLIQMSLHLTF